MSFTENLDEFLGDFDVEALYAGTTVIEGIFDDGYGVAAVGLVGVQGTEPSFVCKAADVDADPSGDTLVVENTTYTIVRGEPDGTGMTRLVLQV